MWCFNEINLDYTFDLASTFLIGGPNVYISNGTAGTTGFWSTNGFDNTSNPCGAITT